MKEKLLSRNDSGGEVELVQVLAGTNRSEAYVPSPKTLALAVHERTAAWKREFMTEYGALVPVGVESETPEVGDFGVSPEDSRSLLELRQAIDSYLGWPSHEAEEAGDYVGRVREVGDALLVAPTERPHELLSAEKLDEELQGIDDTLRRFGFEPEDGVESALLSLRRTIARQRQELRRLHRREADRAKFLATVQHQRVGK